MALPSGDGTTTVGPSFEYVAPERRHWADDGAKRIVVIPDGPYLVLGDVPLDAKAQGRLRRGRLDQLAAP